MKRTIRSIVRSVVVAVFVAILTVIGTVMVFVLSHRDSVTASAQLAEVEFAQLRSRFSGQPPLLDMGRREPLVASGGLPAARPLREFHTVVFDTRGGPRIVRIAVPYWFARRFAGRAHEFKWLGQLTFLDDTEFDPEAIRLPLEQLERRGPGLVADYQHSSGGQFISWVE